MPSLNKQNIESLLLQVLWQAKSEKGSSSLRRLRISSETARTRDQRTLKPFIEFFPADFSVFLSSDETLKRRNTNNEVMPPAISTPKSMTHQKTQGDEETATATITKQTVKQSIFLRR
jgi:hypothetical protein